MRFELNLTNPLVYTPVIVPVPTQEKISYHLYENKRTIANYTTPKEKKKFIGQWKLLINNFAALLKIQINCDLYQTQSSDIYGNLLTRLKRGIAESVLNKGDGLLPNQNSTVFYDLKLFLEAICVYAINHPGEKRIQGLLENLYQKLSLCGPGLFTHLQQAFYELYHPADNLYYWLADQREMIVTMLAETYCDTYKITDIFRAHVYTGFSARAKKNQWHLLQENEHIDDMLINTAIPKEWEDDIYTKFEKDFKEKYETETIALLGERLAAFILDQFNQCAVDGILSSENHDQFSAFFNSITPVLDSFKLSANYFLKVIHELDPTQYQLNQKALAKIDVYVAAGLHASGMLKMDSLALLCVISNARIHGNGMSQIAKKLIDYVSPEIWLREFKQVFDANPPEACQRELRRRTNSAALFRPISAFDNMLDILGLSNIQNIASENKVAVIVNSSIFSEFMVEQLNLDPLFHRFFCEKYPDQQYAPLEKMEPPRKQARR